MVVRRIFECVGAMFEVGTRAHCCGPWTKSLWIEPNLGSSEWGNVNW